jgi:hypothetical protein
LLGSGSSASGSGKVAAAAALPGDARTGGEAGPLAPPRALDPSETLPRGPPPGTTGTPLRNVGGSGSGTAEDEDVADDEDDDDADDDEDDEDESP